MLSDRPSFRSLEFSDIQLVRSWRNSDHIRLKMIDQRVISRSEQVAWFRGLSPVGVHYFIYSLGEVDVGMLSINQVDNSLEFEAGIFCGDKSFLGHWINLSAAFGLYDYAFSSLGMESAFAQVLVDNSAAVRLNSFLGYQTSSISAEGVLHLRLSREDYLKKRSGSSSLSVPVMSLERNTPTIELTSPQ